MNLSEMRRHITARTGERSEDVLVAELNLAALEYWPTTDPNGFIKEVYIPTYAQNVIALPPYVWAVKAVSYGAGHSVSLYTPRTVYTTQTAYQNPLEWTKEGSMPLFRALSGAGRITARVHEENTRPFSVVLAGPDSVANHRVETLSFGASTVEVQGTKVFSDLVNVGKSALTAADVLLYDVNDQHVGTILASQTRADCQVVRIRDPRTVQATVIPTAIYRILFKEPPVTFQVGREQSVDDTVGLALANMVCAELLSRSSQASDQGRATAYARRAEKLTAAQAVQTTQNVNVPLIVGTNPYINTWGGRL